MSGRYSSSTDLTCFCDLGSAVLFFFSSVISTVVMKVADSVVAGPSQAFPVFSEAFSAGLLAGWCCIACSTLPGT